MITSHGACQGGAAFLQLSQQSIVDPMQGDNLQASSKGQFLVVLYTALYATKVQKVDQKRESNSMELARHICHIACAISKPLPNSSRGG
jgi:hypothetical protein